MKTYLTRTFRVLPLLAGATLLAGCMVGPDYHRPDAPKDDRYTAQPMPAAVGQGGDAQHFAVGMDVPAQWWTLFQSPQLDALIKQSLKANPGLAAAQAALRQAQEAQAAGKGALFPQVTADYNVNRQRVASTLASPAASNAYYYTLHTAQLEVSWAPDLFGGNRRQLEALRAQTDVQRFQLEAARLSLTSNVVVAAIQQAGLRAQVEATQKIIAAQQDTLDSFQRQLKLGQLAPSGVAAQVAALAQAQATLPPLQKQLNQQNDAIAALLGQSPAEASVTDFDLADLHLPETLPLTLPAQVVAQRPDVRAAEAQLHAACAQVGVAVSNRLPKFTLSANAGSSRMNIGDLFKDGSAFWNLAADVSEPIFDAGTLKHQQRAAEAALDEAKAQYRGAVIAALQNVADTLYALQADADALQAAQVAEQAARHSLDINRRQFDLGDVNRLAVLQAEQTWQQAEVALVQARVARYSDTAALFQALGGGWWQDQHDGETGNK
ncbi:efflux transporter outer membrane subunit [Rhodanobacter sp. DHG33]|uniref:efflux transporter outer membrane subunit n=1 Tax=Rhodanobacter sp. DHG33 TaxID=2775921 RepID=UPI0017848E9D|nr:efflux transporter outer membrane subunit [Rhodanobacter sp. DHG33]MBD8900081.1 efflux transporter outer membrane subunit [Rhodanobacter sp. DHG33]